MSHLTLIHRARFWLGIGCTFALIVFIVLCARWGCAARIAAVPFGVGVFGVLGLQHVAERRGER